MSFIGDIYRRIMALFSDKPIHFSWVDGRVAASARPMTIDQVKWIKEQGVEVIVSLTESPLPDRWIKEAGVRYFHAPIEDHSCPDPETMKHIVDKIFEEILGGKKVLVHCGAGLGRTGTVLAAYLMVRDNLTPEEAIRMTRKIRPGSIERDQECSLFRFYEFYRRSQG